MAAIIDFDNYDTIPKTLIAYVMGNKEDFINEAGTDPRDRYGLLYSYDDLQIQKHEKCLNKLLQDNKFVAGHYTKVIDRHELDNGMRPLDCMKALENLLRLLDDQGFTDENEIGMLKQYLYNPGEYVGGERIGHLSFFYPLSNGKSCEHYVKSVGGEIIKFNQNRFPNIYSILCSVGVPLKIMATVPFDYVEEHFRFKLKNNIIRTVLWHELNRCADISWMDDEIRTTKKIQEDNIISIQEVVV